MYVYGAVPLYPHSGIFLDGDIFWRRAGRVPDITGGRRAWGRWAYITYIT